MHFVLLAVRIRNLHRLVGIFLTQKGNVWSFRLQFQSKICQEYELKSTTTGIVVVISTFSIEKILSSLMFKKNERNMYLQGLANQGFLEYYLVCLACHEINSEPKINLWNYNENRICDFLTIKMSPFVLICSAYCLSCVWTFWKWFTLLAN